MIAGPQVWVTELAKRFWSAVGDAPPYPRDLRAVLHWLDAVHVLEIPHLTLATAAEHFTRHNIPCPAAAHDRPLAGCFGGHGGIGVILYDPTLSPAEVRFTVAHEVAHYLRDYDAPRRRAARLGARAVEVLDGLRPPTPDERFAGILRHVALVAQTHFLDRDRTGRALTARAGEAERAADRLAYELLAPFADVYPVAVRGSATLIPHLTDNLGLPPAEAARYAVLLGV